MRISIEGVHFPFRRTEKNTPITPLNNRGGQGQETYDDAHDDDFDDQRRQKRQTREDKIELSQAYKDFEKAQSDEK